MLIFDSFLIWAFVVCRNEALRIAFIHEIETLRDGKPYVEHYSKLVKADIRGKDQVFISPKVHFMSKIFFPSTTLVGFLIKHMVKLNIPY